MDTFHIFSGLAEQFPFVLFYLHISQTDINSSNVPVMSITLTSNLSTLIPINDVERMKRKPFLI